MELSVIIVNYNVKHFLEQCLCSVQKAMATIDGEIIVIDNHSSDNSLLYLQPLFPAVKFVCNEENKGFARACNQGWQQAGGRKILFLNPDTIIAEDTLERCIRFFDAHPDAGALGVKMLDGSGRFLKESKRAFPAPLISLYKLAGLARLFPRSPVFARYHLGHLDENKDHEVDVLAGAFMMLRKDLLQQVGGFDETFFMYGEDVDLSYRVQLAGYRNYYFSGTDIIHFKGESTKKGSLNYVKMFYNAMSVFVKKHYGGSKAGIFVFFIHTAIWVRATLSAIARFIRKLGLPLIDTLMIILSFWLVKEIWSEYIRPDIQYESSLLWIAIPSFSFFYLLVAYYAGLYDRWYKRADLLQSALIATVVLLAGYSLLPEQYRFSRGIILFGAGLGFLLISLLRWLLEAAGVLQSRTTDQEASVVIVGSPAEYARAMQLMQEAGMHEKILGRGAVNAQDMEGIDYLTGARGKHSATPMYELVFCEGTLSFKDIIVKMAALPYQTRIKVHADKSRSIVGSDSKDASGESVSIELGFNLSDPYNRRLKRLLDVLIAILGMILLPVHVFFVRKPLLFFENCLRVLIGQRTWVGYATAGTRLPPIRKAIIGSNGLPFNAGRPLPAESLQMLDYWYARDYRPGHDWKIIRNVYRNLGG